MDFFARWGRFPWLCTAELHVTELCRDAGGCRGEALGKRGEEVGSRKRRRSRCFSVQTPKRSRLGKEFHLFQGNHKLVKYCNLARWLGRCVFLSVDSCGLLIHLVSFCWEGGGSVGGNMMQYYLSLPRPNFQGFWEPLGKTILKETRKVWTFISWWFGGVSYVFLNKYIHIWCRKIGEEMISMIWATNTLETDTVDGWNPAPPGMYKTLWIMG